MTTIDIESVDLLKSVSDNAKILRIPRSTLMRLIKKFGLYEKMRFAGMDASKVRSVKLREDYELNPSKCLHCGNKLDFQIRDAQKFCSSSCCQLYRYSSLEAREKQGHVVRLRMRDGTWKKPTRPTTAKHKTCICGKLFVVHPSSETLRKYCSRECSYANKRKSRGGGGPRVGSGRGKSGWYKGYFCHSSWELAWVIYQLDHGVEFHRNLVGYPYTFCGKSHLYYPDFYTKESFVEIKGYTSDLWKSKLSQFPHPIQVIGKQEIQPMLSHAKTKHGKDFVNLYDKVATPPEFASGSLP